MLSVNPYSMRGAGAMVAKNRQDGTSTGKMRRKVCSISRKGSMAAGGVLSAWPQAHLLVRILQRIVAFTCKGMLGF